MTTAARAVRSGNHEPVRIGEPNDWEDGIESGPSGQMLREIVTQNSTWASSTWITVDGEAWQRTFDPFADMFVWHGPKKITEKNGTLHLLVGATAQPQQMRLERALALAYLACPKDFMALHATQIYEGPLTASRIGWVRAGTTCHERATVSKLPQNMPIANDEWQPLVYVWFSLSGDLLEKFEVNKYGKYMLSRRGWLKSPHTGRMTLGTRSPSGRMWSSIAGAGHIWIDEAVLRTFASCPLFRCRIKHTHGIDSNQLKHLEWAELVPLCEKHVEMCQIMESCSSITEVIDLLHLTKGSVWERIKQVCRHVPLSKLKWTQKLIHPKINQFMETLAPQQLTTAEKKAEIDLLMQESTTWAAMHKNDQYGMIQITFELKQRLELEKRGFR